MKKFLIGLGAVLGLILVAIIILPFIIDANQFKPQIEKAVNDNLNADFKVGDLKFSLWGGLHIQVSQLVLSEKGGKPIFSMNDAKLEIPISSVFGGKPDITLAVKSPEINVVVDKDGKMNVMKITKPSSAQPQQKTTGSGASAAAGLAFDLSFKITDGHVAYIDQRKNSRTDLTGLDLEIRKFGVNQPFDFSFKTSLNAKEMKDMVLRGPVLLNGKAAIYISSAGLDHVDLKCDADMTGLTVKYADLFSKGDGVALKIQADIAATDKNLKMNDVKFIANDAVVTTKGTVENFDHPVVNVEVQSNKFVFEHWQNILKPLKDFDMKGIAQMNVKVNGTTEKLGYSGKATVSDANLKAPGIVPRVTDLKATLNFSNDGVTLSDAGLKIGASDLGFSGTVRNFARPVIIFNMKSVLFDVDALLPQKTPEQAKAEEKAAATETPMSDAQIEAAVAGPIVLMKKNPMMRGMDFTAHVDMKKIVAHKAELQNLNAEANFKDLVMSLKKATVQAFGGHISFATNIDFKGSEPAYTASGDVTNLDLNAAVTNQMPIAKDTIFGKATAKFAVSGVGVTKTKVKQLLKGNGHFNIANGSWNSLSAMKQISDKLSSLPPNIRGQIGNISITDRFRQLKSDFSIGGGRINIQNMVADMEGPNTTVTGQGWVDFDMNNEISGKIITPSGHVPPDIRAADGRMSIPYQIGCALKSPCIKPEPTVNALLTAYGKEEGKKVLKKAVEGIDNPQVKELLKKLPF